MLKSLTRATAGLLCAGLAYNTVRLRGRLRGMPLLESSNREVDARFRFVMAEGVEVDAATRRSAAALAIREGLQVVDLVPADLCTEHLLTLARTLDTATLRTDLLGRAPMTNHAVLAEASLLEAMGFQLAAGEDLTGLSSAEFAALMARLKKHSPTGVGVALAPALHSTARTPQEMAALVEEVSLVPPLFPHAVRFCLGALTALCLRITPVWGAAALIAYWVEPYLVRAGTRFVPTDLHRSTALRPITGPCQWLITWHALIGPADPHADLRCEYEAELAQGYEHFLEPRRDTCPWCGSPELSVRVTPSDVVQGKPGRFTLEECGTCGHVFQNPRLTLAGLDFYYRDVYDGIGEKMIERSFAAPSQPYRARAEMVRPHATPQRWLDVGTGHGHFCLVAREVWPETSFDGLDMGVSVEAAEKYGWVDRGYRGTLPDLAEKLAESYDVVSMHHYMEHVLDPFMEMEAAHAVLKPGGHLLIEVPDPEWWVSRLLGRLWSSWIQPQHLNMAPVGNMKQALQKRGFTVVAEQHGSTHLPAEFLFSVAIAINSLFPDARMPWSGRKPTTLSRTVRGAAWVAASPALLGGAIVDTAMAACLRRSGRGGNTYRLLARKDEECRSCAGSAAQNTAMRRR